MKLRFHTLRLALPLAALLALAGCSGGGDGGKFVDVVDGASQTVNGSTLRTYAVVDDGTVLQAGMVVPFALIQTPPPPGTGPLGSYSLAYPAVVQQTTFLNHIEFAYLPMGHDPEGLYNVEHYDIHGYSMTEEQVRAIAPGPDPQAPAPNRIPAGYVYPGQDASVPQMGVHAFNPQDAAPPFVTDLLLGFYNGSMNFIEPMVIRQRFLNKESFTLDIAVPQVLGRATRYPTKFNAEYDQSANVYRFVYTDFVTVAQ